MPRVEKQANDGEMPLIGRQEQRSEAIDCLLVTARSAIDEGSYRFLATGIGRHVEGGLSLVRGRLDVRSGTEEELDDFPVPLVGRIVQGGETLLVSAFQLHPCHQELADDLDVAGAGCRVERSDASDIAEVGIGAVREEQPHRLGIPEICGDMQGCQPGGALLQVRGHAEREELGCRLEISVPNREEESLGQAQSLRLPIHVTVWTAFRALCSDRSIPWACRELVTVSHKLALLESPLLTPPRRIPENEGWSPGGGG